MLHAHTLSHTSSLSFSALSFTLLHTHAFHVSHTRTFAATIYLFIPYLKASQFFSRAVITKESFALSNFIFLNWAIQVTNIWVSSKGLHWILRGCFNIDWNTSRFGNIFNLERRSCPFLQGAEKETSISQKYQYIYFILTRYPYLCIRPLQRSYSETIPNVLF